MKQVDVSIKYIHTRIRNDTRIRNQIYTRIGTYTSVRHQLVGSQSLKLKISI